MSLCLGADIDLRSFDTTDYGLLTTRTMFGERGLAAWNSLLLNDRCDFSGRTEFKRRLKTVLFQRD